MIRIEVEKANAEVQEELSSELRIAMPQRLARAWPHIAVGVAMRSAYGLWPSMNRSKYFLCLTIREKTMKI